MGSKKSIYLSDAAEKILDLDDKTGDSLSGRINATILRFGRMMSESRPALSDAEWLATCLIRS